MDTLPAEVKHISMARLHQAAFAQESYRKSTIQLRQLSDLLLLAGSSSRTKPELQRSAR